MPSIRAPYNDRLRQTRTITERATRAKRWMYIAVVVSISLAMVPALVELVRDRDTFILTHAAFFIPSGVLSIATLLTSMLRAKSLQRVEVILSTLVWLNVFARDALEIIFQRTEPHVSAGGLSIIGCGLLALTLPSRSLLRWVLLLFGTHLAIRWIGFAAVGTAGVDPLLALQGDAIRITVIMSMVFVNNYGYDLLAMRAENVAMRELAFSDALTGLPNRRALVSHMTNHDDFCVILADVDNFKTVNDAHGHDHGDLVLIDIAIALHDVAGDHGVVSRWGGEEFVVWLPGIPARDAVAIAERMRARIQGLPTHPPITLSLGVAHRRDLEPADAVIHRADALMYGAKMSGKNRVFTDTTGPVVDATNGFTVAHEAPSVNLRRARTGGRPHASTVSITASPQRTP